MATMNHKSPSSQYPAVGDNYMKRQKQYGTGEWEGYIYDPWIDKYRPDPKKQQDYYEQQGLVDKKKDEGLLEGLAPVAATAAAYEGGKVIGPEIYAAGKSGLLSLGNAGTATTATTGGTTAGAGTSALASTAAENAAWNAAATGGEAAAIEAGATGAGTTAGGAGTGGTAATGSGSLSAIALPLAALLATAYTGNKIYEAYKGGEGKSSKDSALDPMKDAATWLVGGMTGGQLAGAGGFLGKTFGSKKDADQKARDAVRKAFQEAGFVDQDFNVSLAGGKKFNIGADGTKNLYNVDLSTPEAERDLKLVAPLAQILTGGDKKLGSDFSGYFTNAIRSDGDVLANAKEMYGKAGITSWDQARAALNELRTAGKLTDQEVAVYDQGLANIFGNQPLEAPLANLSTTPAIIPVQTPAASGLTGLMALEKPTEAALAAPATPVARPVAASPFSGLMALGRPANPEEQATVVPVPRGGYR